MWQKLEKEVIKWENVSAISDKQSPQDTVHLKKSRGCLQNATSHGLKLKLREWGYTQQTLFNATALGSRRSIPLRSGYKRTMYSLFYLQSNTVRMDFIRDFHCVEHSTRATIPVMNDRAELCVTVAFNWNIGHFPLSSISYAS